jgi:hypothetical protein
MTAFPVELLAEAGMTALHRRERRETALRAYATRDDGSVVNVTLIDLSYDGCGIDSPVALRAGETMTLAVHRRGTVAATVRWVAGRKAGLVFAVGPEAAADGPAQAARHFERIAVDADVALRRAGKLHFQVHVYDVSPDGCKAEFVERPEIREHVWIKFTGIEALEAQVCWLAGSKAGLKFARPIHPAVFDMLIERLKN